MRPGGPRLREEVQLSLNARDEEDLELPTGNGAAGQAPSQ